MHPNSRRWRAPLSDVLDRWRLEANEPLPLPRRSDRSRPTWDQARSPRPRRGLRSPIVVAVQKTTAVPSPTASPRGCMSPKRAIQYAPRTSRPFEGEPEQAVPEQSGRHDAPQLKTPRRLSLRRRDPRAIELRLYQPSRRGVSFLRGIILRRHNASIVFQLRLTCLP